MTPVHTRRQRRCALPPTEAARSVCHLLVAFAVACSGGDPPGAGGAQAHADTVADADVGAVAAADDLSRAADAVVQDGAVCPGAAGCACKANGDCAQLLCVESPQGLRCAGACGLGCPAGTLCMAVPGSGGDTASGCLPRFARLCRPCIFSQECATLAEAGGRCVDHGDFGSFCGVPCATGADCAAGQGCLKVATSEGEASWQCVPVSSGKFAPGMCACSPLAMAQGAATTCAFPAAGPHGKRACPGERSCGPAGLSACATPVAGAGPCEDRQCEGKADGSACDDDDPCTNGDTCQGAVCVGGPGQCACKTTADCAPQDAAKPCSGKHVCDKTKLPWTCVADAATAPVCSANKPCWKSACDPATGLCALKPDADAPCDDGNPCTGGDKCGAAGECKAGGLVCECANDGDCPDDADLCNGKPYCDKTAAPWACKPNPKTVVQCGAAATACEAVVCEPKSGQCVVKTAPDGSACDDGAACSTGDACLLGKCVAAKANCPCTDDAQCAQFEDGDACNGTLYCETKTGKCQVDASTLVVCPSVGDSGCVVATCDPKTGQCSAVPADDGVACDDGDACSKGDKCQAGQCVAGASTCACKTDADCKPKDDGNACNGTLYCNAAAGTCAVNPKTIVQCATGLDPPCMKTVCAPKTGKCVLKVKEDGTPCSDGLGCTGQDQCQGGACQPGVMTCPCKVDADCGQFDDANACNGTLGCNQAAGYCVVAPGSAIQCPVDDDGPCQKRVCQAATGACPLLPLPDGEPCDDGIACTSQTECDSGKCAPVGKGCACKTTADCKAQEDGNACNGTLICDASSGSCAVDPKTVVQCSAPLDPTCGVPACQPATGKCMTVPKNEGKACTDASTCTVGDQCQQGACIPGKNACACLADADCKPQPGDNLCLGQKVCNKASVPYVCVHDPKLAVACAAAGDTPCLKNQCTPSTGKCTPQPVPPATACSDGDACTIGDTCAGGKCVPGPKKQCEDGIACTLDVCAPASGACSNPLPATPTACDDGDPCTQPGTCVGATCKPGPATNCDDGNMCTQDACVKNVGCTKKATDGWPCNDGDPCTLAESCKASACAPASFLPCVDGIACTKDGCTPGKGCLYLPATGAPCNDNDLCTSADQCTQAGTCSGAPVVCNDQNPCTSDSCAKSSGCVHMPSAGPCDDGNPCTAVSGCVAGKCIGSLGVVCDDNNACTANGCDCTTGKCVYTPLACAAFAWTGYKYKNLSGTARCYAAKFSSTNWTYTGNSCTCAVAPKIATGSLVCGPTCNPLITVTVQACTKAGGYCGDANQGCAAWNPTPLKYDVPQGNKVMFCLN